MKATYLNPARQHGHLAMYVHTYHLHWTVMMAVGDENYKVRSRLPVYVFLEWLHYVRSKEWVQYAEYR